MKGHVCKSLLWVKEVQLHWTFNPCCQGQAETMGSRSAYFCPPHDSSIYMIHHIKLGTGTSKVRASVVFWMEFLYPDVSIGEIRH